MTQWEYQVAPIPLHNEALMLNNFGEDGWELVAIHTNAQGGLVAQVDPQPADPALVEDLSARGFRFRAGGHQ